MSGNMIPFGEHEGLRFQTDEVANGLKFQCVCSKCSRGLVSANEGTQVLVYFRLNQYTSKRRSTESGQK